MRLTARVIPRWPKLAWLARFPAGSQEIEVLCGAMVEAGDDWIVEAVWPGEFARGDFDRCDMVWGSGVRVRGGRVVFVSAGSGVDRLWYCLHEGCWYVANSLPALLASARLELRDDYRGYHRDMESVEDLGIRSYVRTLPTAATPVTVLYLRNLQYDGRTLAEVDKPSVPRRFLTFDEYFHFLTDTAACLGNNLRASQRRYPIIPLVGISSGYDSGATAVIAKHAGCRRAATIKQSRSLWRGSDSGADIARCLGLSCRSYDRSPENYRREETIWAGAGLAGGLNFTIFDYPEPLCLLFSGSYGDKVWDRFHHNLSEPLGDRDHLLGEFRLIQGIFQCVVPWWGIGSAQQINALGRQGEMAPWSIGGKYDRPIARRILEQAGVPRRAFGTRKKDTASNAEFLWPFSRDAQARFAEYLRSRGCRAPRPWLVTVLRRFAQWESLLHLNLFGKAGMRRRLRPWQRLSGTQLLFHWANHELKQMYGQGLAAGDDFPDSVPRVAAIARPWKQCTPS